MKANNEGIRAVNVMEITALKGELAQKSTRIEQLNTEKEDLKSVVTAIKHALRDEIQLVQERFH